MKVNEHLAIVAMEECAEIQQALAKSLRFGFKDHHPERPSENNGSEVLTEFYQLVAMIEQLQANKVLKELSATEIELIKQEKIKKVNHYMSYSQTKGLLNSE